MNVLTLRRLRDYYNQYPEAAGHLKAWHQVVTRADWKAPVDIKAQFGTADILPDDRACFNINGNRYRLIVHVDYTYRSVMIKWFGTHPDYMKIDAATIGSS